MKKFGLNELRSEYLNFFRSKDHLILKSYSLIPSNDKSLLLINAGMAPLKDYFTGEKKMAKDRVASSQRCIRTADIDRVGKTHRHATFFEMLGNFSFGDYFKKEAIRWAWEFLTVNLEIPEEKLSATVFEEDDEAYDLWKNDIGLPPSRIHRLGKEDNFWELEVGPCGPCSEIFVDRGEEYACDNPDCGPACDCDRFMEVWNLVFTQFDKDADGVYHPLAHPNIDTGMGLERLTLIMEGAENIFEIGIMKDIIAEIERLSDKKYNEDPGTDESIRVISDHVKAMTFLIYDGVVPSNEERGYVLRRLIRRAYRHGKLIGIRGAFLTKVAKKVMEAYYSEYPELTEAEDRIFKILRAEEDKFQETINQGNQMLMELIDFLDANNIKILDGESAFKLYDTYGFPLDLTKEILLEHDLEVDEDSFRIKMKEQRERSREARATDQGWHSGSELDTTELDPSTFTGYESLGQKAKICALYLDESPSSQLQEGQKGIVVLDETPFYGESGGQVGDEGTIFADGAVAKVVDTKKTKDDTVLHFVEISKGTLKSGDMIEARVDEMRRKDIMRNHSATHLLHAALRQVVGTHINQAGSLVDDKRLRFDVTHYEAITAKELKEIQDLVNRKIAEGLPAIVETMSLEESQDAGAIGLFEDKYRDVVRVVSMGDFSRELCGGTHVSNTSEILMFKILSESSVSAGVRRIEAITGREVYRYLQDQESVFEQIAMMLKAKKKELIDRINQVLADGKEMEKTIAKFHAEKQASYITGILDDVKEVDDVKLYEYRFEGVDMDSLRNIADRVRDRVDEGVILFSSVVDGKLLFLSTVSKALVKRKLHAGQIVKVLAQTTGGNGGGRPDSASAGGKDARKLDEAFQRAEEFIKSELNRKEA